MKRNPWHGPYVAIAGIDLASGSREALRVAIELARLHGGTVVHAVYVDSVHAISDEDMYLRGLDERREAAELKLRLLGERFLREAHIGSVPDTIEVVRPHYRVGDPAEELTDLARDLNADVIVVGTKGLRGFSRFMRGSVAETVVRLASCPVHVVRDRERAALRAAG